MAKESEKMDGIALKSICGGILKGASMNGIDFKNQSGGDINLKGAKPRNFSRRASEPTGAPTGGKVSLSLTRGSRGRFTRAAFMSTSAHSIEPRKSAEVENAKLARQSIERINRYRDEVVGEGFTRQADLSKDNEKCYIPACRSRDATSHSVPTPVAPAITTQVINTPATGGPAGAVSAAIAPPAHRNALLAAALASELTPPESTAVPAPILTSSPTYPLLPAIQSGLPTTAHRSSGIIKGSELAGDYGKFFLPSLQSIARGWAALLKTEGVLLTLARSTSA